MEFVHRGINEYCERMSQKEPDILRALSKETYETMDMPQMLSGHLQGRVLSFLVKLTRARSILEVGTFTGYSALCMAEGLPEKGTLLTLDVDEHVARLAQKYFKLSPYSQKITMRLGPALQTLAQCNQQFDFVFIDADKINYKNYYEAVLPLLEPGSLIVFDNCLWSGRVLAPVDESSQALSSLNDFLARDERIENVLLPIRDGLHLARKL